MTITIGWQDQNGRKWPERLDIDLDHLDADSIRQLEKTEQWCPDEEVYIHWRVKCSLEERSDGGFEIVVEYTQNQQDDENLLGYLQQHGHQFCFGINRIIVGQTDQRRRKGVCKWTGEDPDECGKDEWTVIDGPRPTRKREEQERDWRLRADLLAEDGKCVISKERTPEVLDAAHIVPVAEGGEDSVKNAIILRTDIHRLYDRGMFLISPKNGKISKSSMSRNLSRKYKKLLRNAMLPERTLTRVQEALQERWSNRRPDTGRG